MSSAGILAPAHAEKRAEILALLERAYWMEMETVMSYVANAARAGRHPRRGDRRGARDRRRRGARPRPQVRRAHQGALRHAARLARLHGRADRAQPPEDATDVVTVIRGVIAAEAGAIEHYNRIIEAADGVDWATQDMVIDILRDEEGHLRQFERYLREFD